MTKLLLALSLLMPFFANADTIHFHGPNFTENKEWHKVLFNKEFCIETQLTVHPKDYQKWKLVSEGPFSLIEEVFFEPDMAGIGSAGIQRWFFKPTKIQEGTLVFEREVNNIKERRTINIEVEAMSNKLKELEKKGLFSDFPTTIE